MDISPDYSDLFRVLNAYKVRYLIVGAYAVVYYTEPRFTKDLDIWVKADTGNAKRIYKALTGFGAPMKNVRPDDFTDKKMIYQIGVDPVRVDIMMGLHGMIFDAAWKKRTRSRYGRVPVNIIGVKDLMRAKRKSRRAQDRLDLDNLLKTVKRKR